MMLLARLYEISGLVAIGRRAGIGNVVQILVRHQCADFTQHGQAADAGIVDAYGIIRARINLQPRLGNGIRGRNDQCRFSPARSKIAARRQ